MIYHAQSGDLNIALTGDSMPTRHLTPFTEDGYLALVELLRGADCAYTNLETTVRRDHEGLHDLSQGTLMSTPPELLEDLKWLGVNLVSCANNHASDYGHGGIEATLAHLQAAGLAHAGSGMNLAEARAPGYVDTPGGRIGLISANAFFEPWQRASTQGPDLKGRPGINPLDFKTNYTIDQAALDQLRRMSSQLGFDQANARRRRNFFSDKEAPDGNESEVNFLGRRFTVGDEFAWTTRADDFDEEENLRSVAEARRQADWVLFSLHCHEFGPRNALAAEVASEMEDLARFAREFSQKAIEAGADMVAIHGVHFTLGVEIHAGKPIFYSLGNLILQNETVPYLPRESYRRFDLGVEATPADFQDARTAKDTKGMPAYPEFWRSFIAVCRFAGGTLERVELHPIDLGFGLPRAQRGRPVIAGRELGDDLIERLAGLSSQYGTKMENQDGIGIIRP